MQVAEAKKDGLEGKRYQQPVLDAEMVISVGRKEDLAWAKNASLPLMRQVQSTTLRDGATVGQGLYSSRPPIPSERALSRQLMMAC